LQPGPQLTVGDYWRQSGQVQVSRTLYAGGLPTFQGLGVNQAALLIDGIPVNPGWLGNRNDHGGLLPTVGIVTLDILAAPTSVLYGGNAQGGVLGYTTFGPAQFENAREGLHGYVQGRYFSQWKGLGEEGVLEYQSGDFYSKTSIGHAQVGDFDWGRQGIGTEEEKLAPLFHPINGWQSDSLVPNLQPHTALGTGFKRWEVNQGLLLRSLGPLWNLYGQFQYASLPQQTQTARTLLADSNGTPVFADWRFVDRDRRMFAGGFELPVETQLFNHAFFKVSHQSWRENAQFRRLGDTLQSYYFDRLNQLDLRLDLVNMILGKQVIYYGVRYRQDQSESRAYGLSLANRNPILIPNWRPDGGGRMRQWGIYYHQVFDLSIGAKAWLGVSYDRSLLQVTYQRAAEWPWLPIEYSLPNNAVSGCAGVHVKAGSGWDWQVDASSGFRTLNLEDASAVYGSQRGIPISPNSALFPSYVWQGQMVIGHQMGLKDRVEGALFYRRIMDGFALGESPWEGQDSIDFMGQYSAIQSLQNSVEAHQVGLRLGGNIPMGKHWMANFSLHSLYQRTAEIGGHGGFFPAFGKAELVWDWKRVSARANILFSSRGGNQGNVLGWEGGGIGAGAGYWVPSLSVTYSPFSWLVVNLSAENITDTRYRMAQSRFYEPGRNMGAGLRIQF
jgi:hemoglobin/transferrin/lactoferrin receptor protein